MSAIRILVVGCGHMGSAHAKAYQDLNGFEVVGLVNRSEPKLKALANELGGVPTFSSFEHALETLRPDAVSINTYPDTHGTYSIKAMEAGAHVFVEKPLAETVEEAKKVLQAAKKFQKKLVVGYILRHHPSWQEFITQAKLMGSPLVMRMNLNQQSSGEKWAVHRNLMNSLSPIVDCGVHYIDVMCQMTSSAPVRVSAIGARLTEEIKPEMYNYGQLQICFADGSVGWYESGWGPMISENAHFIKDVMGPKGSVSMIPSIAHRFGESANIAHHTKAEKLIIHHASLNQEEQFSSPSEVIELSDEPDHNLLCTREQLFFLEAIINDLDLSSHHSDVLHSLQVVLAADQSVRTGEVVFL